MLDGIRWVRFHDNRDERGRLTAIESGVHLGFNLERVLLVYQVTPGADRGGHAHRETDQVLSCVHGRMRVDVSDGVETRTFELQDAGEGLFVPRMLWIRLYDFQEQAV